MIIQLLLRYKKIILYDSNDFQMFLILWLSGWNRAEETIVESDWTSSLGDNVLLNPIEGAGVMSVTLITNDNQTRLIYQQHRTANGCQ